MKVKGLEKVLSNLDKEIIVIKKNTLKGILAASIFVEGESNEIVPVNLGPLINSSYSDVEEKKQFIKGRVGYTVKYAGKVHEFPESYNYTKPGTGPKFLWKSVSKNMTKIFEIIKARVKF